MGAAALQQRFVTEQLQRQRTVSMATDDVFSARSRKCKGLDGDVDDYGGRRAVRRRTRLQWRRSVGLRRPRSLTLWEVYLIVGCYSMRKANRRECAKLFQQ